MGRETTKNTKTTKRRGVPVLRALRALRGKYQLRDDEIVATVLGAFDPYLFCVICG
jgi:hypothetical protein